MKTPSSSNSSPRRIILWASLGGGLLVLIGSLAALNQAGFTPAVFAGLINETVSRLAGANLLVKADRTILPADGKTATQIHVSSSNTSLPITAKLTSGGGTLVLTAQTPGEAIFTYTPPTISGQAVITFNSGSLQQTLELEIKVALTPTAPTITAPADGSTTIDPKPELTGTAPANTKVLITDNGTTNTTVTVDDKGNFRVTLEKALSAGKHVLAAISQGDLGVLSPVSNLVTLTVQAEPIRIDTAHIRTSPTHPTAGDSFGLFVPASLNTAKIVVEMQGKNYILQDLHKTSIFTGTLPSPDQPGTLSANLVAYDLGGNATRFDNIINLVVISR